MALNVFQGFNKDWLWKHSLFFFVLAYIFLPIIGRFDWHADFYKEELGMFAILIGIGLVVTGIAYIVKGIGELKNR